MATSGVPAPLRLTEPTVAPLQVGLGLACGALNVIVVVLGGGGPPIGKADDAAQQHRTVQINVFKVVFISLFLTAF